MCNIQRNKKAAQEKTNLQWRNDSIVVFHEIDSLPAHKSSDFNKFWEIYATDATIATNHPKKDHMNLLD